MEKYGYFAVFLLAFIDHTGTPGGLLLSIGVSTAGYLDIYLIFLISFLAGIVGDIVFYLIGRYGGKKILNRLTKDRESVCEKVDNASALFNKHRSSVVLWGRFPPFIGKYVMVLAGTLSFPFYQFVILSAFGGLIMVALYGIPYYFLGNELNHLFESKTLALYLTIAILFLQLLVSWIWTVMKRD